MSNGETSTPILNHGPAGAYPTTIWSEVRRGSSQIGEEAVAALNDLLLRYQQPLRQHVDFRFRVTEDQAADWFQSFVLQKVILKQLLAVASPQRGRFRTFLLNAFDNFIITEQRKENALRRRPVQGFVSLEELEPEEASGSTRESTHRFAANWAREVLGQTLERMEAACAAIGRPERWAVFQRRLLNPLLLGDEPIPYDELVREFGFRSPAEAVQSLFRAKEMFARILNEVLAEYADDSANVEDELRELKAALGQT